MGRRPGVLPSQAEVVYFVYGPLVHLACSKSQNNTYFSRGFNHETCGDMVDTCWLIGDDCTFHLAFKNGAGVLCTVPPFFSYLCREIMTLCLLGNMCSPIPLASLPCVHDCSSKWSRFEGIKPPTTNQIDFLCIQCMNLFNGLHSSSVRVPSKPAVAMWHGHTDSQHLAACKHIFNSVAMEA